MKKITDKEYDEYQDLKRAIARGRILTPDGLRLICESNSNDPIAIGKYMLETLHALENTPETNILVKLSPDIVKCLKLANKPYIGRTGCNPLG